MSADKFKNMDEKTLLFIEEQRAYDWRQTEITSVRTCLRVDGMICPNILQTWAVSFLSYNPFRIGHFNCEWRRKKCDFTVKSGGNRGCART